MTKINPGDVVQGRVRLSGRPPINYLVLFSSPTTFGTLAMDGPRPGTLINFSRNLLNRIRTADSKEVAQVLCTNNIKVLSQ